MKGQALGDCHSAGRFANAALKISDGHREAERPFRTALVRRRETNELLCFRERELTIAGNPAPPAYVLITNRAFMQALDETECGETTIARAFKIDDFPPGQGARTLSEPAARVRCYCNPAGWRKDGRKSPCRCEERSGEANPIRRVSPARDCFAVAEPRLAMAAAD